jgi:TIR domain-containing protein
VEERVALTAKPETVPVERDVVFLSKATPGDDELALWLAPKLEAAGYKVFTDVRTLEPGDRWRAVITSTLQNQACKMLLCCSNATLAATGVQEEIEIGLDLAKPRFVIPLGSDRTRSSSASEAFSISTSFADGQKVWKNFSRR